MPVIQQPAYQPSWILPGGHLQTIIPGLYRRVEAVQYQRERIATPDQDFLDLDWSAPGSQRLAIVSHGLEGNASRPYVLAMVTTLNRAGWDVLAWNYRGCSGEINRQLRFYHSGATDDLDTVVQHALGKDRYKEVVMIGFSLGGNLTLKYLGERGGKLHPAIKASVTFSVPCDLHDACLQISRRSNYVYERRFFKSLKMKLEMKKPLFPEQIDLVPLSRIRSLLEFDETYTAPIHGFAGAIDYYTRNSCRQFLPGITVPSLIVNAANDPFIGSKCYPREEAQSSHFVHLEVPRAGGHCGFSTFSGKNEYWPGSRVLGFVES